MKDRFPSSGAKRAFSTLLPRDLLYLSLKACKLISPTMNIMNYKLSFIYRLPRLLLIVQGLRPAVKGYRLWYELPPAPAFRRHKETSFQRGSEGGVPILYLIQNRGREIDERSIWNEERPLSESKFPNLLFIYFFFGYLLYVIFNWSN